MNLENIQAELDAAKHYPLDERVAIYNQLSDLLYRFIDLPHPVLRVQLIKSERVIGNDYNPNKVAPPEMRLLEMSIRKDGVTMAVVAARDDKVEKHVVVDGFHRREVMTTCEDIAASLGGYIPLVELNKSVEERMTATVRHNMARGSHQVELSAKLVTALTKHHWTNERISQELGMDAEEVLRLKQITGLAEAFQDREFSKAWE